jgi:hypothetical protein
MQFLIDDGLTIDYQRGFADGERDSRADRLAGTLMARELPLGMHQYARGYADGYTPRSWAWAGTTLQERA